MENPSDITYIASATGKLILFGEHAAVYGCPAIGFGLPCRTRVIFQPDDSGSPSFPGMDEKDAAVMLELLKATEKEKFPLKNTNGRWTVQSNIPRVGGFGSSGALCVAVARILMRIKSTGYYRSIHRLANRLERRFHGNPSGIDTGMSSMPGLSTWYPKKRDIPVGKKIKIPVLHLIYGALPREQETASSVEELHRSLVSGDNKKASIIQEMHTIITSFIKQTRRTEINSNDFLQLTADTISRIQSQLSESSLSNKDLDQALSIAQSNGALAGKLSGGGMGGAFVLLVQDQSMQEHLIKTLPALLAGDGISLTEPLKAINVGGL